MLPKNRPPVHPGEMLQEEFLKPLGITQTEFAHHLGWTQAKLNEIIKGKRGLTAESAVAIASALGMDPQVWMNLQTSFDLWHALQGKESPKQHPKVLIAS